MNAGANSVAVNPVGGETIDGGPFHSLTAQWARVEIISNGSAWFIIAHQ